MSPMKKSPKKTHNFIVVDSEADFAAEKRKRKDEQMKKNVDANTTSVKLIMDNQVSFNHLDQKTKSDQATTNSLPTSMDLNLNMSAYEMRKLIASRRNVKAECKKQTMDLRQKYEIIQQM